VSDAGAVIPPLTGIVTGGTRGIGLGLAAWLLRRGASVAATYRRDESEAENARRVLAECLSPQAGLLVLQGDAGNPDEVDRQYQRVRRELGPVNVLVNNAGLMPRGNLETITDSIWRETIRVNLDSAFYWTSRVVPDMKAAGFGRIVNISSIAARGGGVIGPHYAASKAGMIGLTRYAARELGPAGITVNAIAPAFIGDAGVFRDWNPDQKARLQEQVFTPRIGRVEDVVRAFAYLIDSPFVTGVTLDVNGGAFMI